MTEKRLQLLRDIAAMYEMGSTYVEIIRTLGTNEYSVLSAVKYFGLEMRGSKNQGCVKNTETFESWEKDPNWCHDLSTQKLKQSLRVTV